MHTTYGVGARTATGYASHSACGVRFLAGREDDPSSDLPPYPIRDWLRTTSNDEAGTATSSLLGLYRRTSFASEAGCRFTDEPPATGTAVVSAQLPIATPLAVDTALLSEDTRLAISAAVADAMLAPGSRGIVVTAGGAIVVEDYASGFSADTPQLGWSMTKSAASLLVGLVQAGAVENTSLDLHAPTGLPWWEPTDPRSAITPWQLLHMTSGLEFEESYEVGSGVAQMLYNSPDMADYAAQQPLLTAPGEIQRYSTGNSVLLCRWLQDSTGLSVTQLQQLLRGPLGMSSARLEADDAGTAACGSSLWATPRDWAQLGTFALNGGVVAGQHTLPPRWMEELTTVTARPFDDLAAPYGAQWVVNAYPDGRIHHPELPADAYWASGQDGQFVIVLPSHDVVISRLGFSPGGSISSLGVLDLAAAVVAALEAG